MPKPFRIKERATSFVYAGHGLRMLLQTQHNAWLHLLATLAVGVMAYVLGVSRYDCLWLLLAIALVWLAECFNTALEFVADAVTQDYRVEIKRAKDVAAGGVLLAALFAVITGGVIFLPYF